MPDHARESTGSPQTEVNSEAPVAVFDSGLGGLTVVRAIREHLPFEEIVYFGDTARVPYGNKSQDTVTRFTREICSFLLDMTPKCIIAACNTASALGVPEVQPELAVPILGVVKPAARQVATVAGRRLVAVLGTEATVSSCAFERAIHAVDPRIRVVQKSCPLFVPLVEEGRGCGDALTRLAIEEYLAPIKRLRPDAVLLGCTHYPVLRQALQEYFGHGVQLIDCGAAVAGDLRALLESRSLNSKATTAGSIHCYVSDFPPRFSALGERFAGEPLQHVLRARADTWTPRGGDDGRSPGYSTGSSAPRRPSGVARTPC